MQTDESKNEYLSSTNSINNIKKSNDRNSIKMVNSHKSDESSYLLDHQNNVNSQDHPNMSTTPIKLPYSVFRARLSMLLACVFTLAVTKGVFIAQYLLDRLRAENNFNGSDHSPNSSHTNEIQGQVSNYMMQFSIVGAVPAFFSCLIFGAIVDMVGRKPALISATFGNLAMTILVFLIIRFHLNKNLFYLAYGIDGICGSYFVFLIANFSIVADMSVDKRGLIFWIGAFQAIPFSTQAATNIGIGQLITHSGYMITSLVTVFPVSLAFLLAVFVIPETLPVKRTPITAQKLGASVMRVVSLYAKDGSKNQRYTMALSLLIFFVSYVNTMNVSNTDTLYQRRLPLKWNPSQLGYYAAYKQLTNSILGMFFLWSLRKLKFISDEQIGMIGAIFTAAGYLLEGFVRKTWQMYMVPLLLFPGFNVTIVARGVMSSLSGPDKQGVMFSSIALIEVICMIVASFLYEFYAAMLSITPGAMYFLMSAIAFVDFLLYFPFFYVYKRTRKTFYEEL